MLPRQHRTPTRFFKTKTLGKKYQSPHLSLFVTNNAGIQPRFSFSISKKISKTAPKRNLFRRRGYAVVYKFIKKPKIGQVFFFNAKKGADKVSYTELENEISGLLKQTKIG